MKYFFLFLTLISVPIKMYSQSSYFEIQGHRGCRGLMPENTLPAFMRAIDEGVQTLEMDVVISKDYKVVVSHDPFFNSAITTSPSGIPLKPGEENNLYQLKYRQIKKYDTGLRGNSNFPEQKAIPAHKPLLSDVLKAAEKYAAEKGISPLKYNIELKSEKEEYGISQPFVEEFSDLVYAEIKKNVPLERVCIQSFDFNLLNYWYAGIKIGKYKRVQLSALIEPTDNNDIEYNLEKLGFKPDIWSPYFAVLNEQKIKLLKEKGIKVIPWTVNKIDDMLKVKHLGCDGLITDYPDRAKNL